MLYFALVFGAGFVLGTIYTLHVVPHLGTRTAELVETPFMLGVTIVAARWVVRRFAVSHAPSLGRDALTRAAFVAGRGVYAGALAQGPVNS